MNDKQIVELYFERSEKAVLETDNKYKSYLIKIALNILQSIHDAEEAVNDAYLALWNSIPPSSPSNLATFTAKILRRICIDKLKHQNAEKRGGGEMPLILEELSYCIPSGQTAEEEFLNSEFSKTINTFLYLLSEEKRNIFICRYFYADSIKSIAKEFGYSESKVKSILHRTCKQLKDYLYKEGF